MLESVDSGLQGKTRYSQASTLFSSRGGCLFCHLWATCSSFVANSCSSPNTALYDDYSYCHRLYLRASPSSLPISSPHLLKDNYSHASSCSSDLWGIPLRTTFPISSIDRQFRSSTAIIGTKYPSTSFRMWYTVNWQRGRKACFRWLPYHHHHG